MLDLRISLVAERALSFFAYERCDSAMPLRDSTLHDKLVGIFSLFFQFYCAQGADYVRGDASITERERGSLTEPILRRGLRSVRKNIFFVTKVLHWVELYCRSLFAGGGIGIAIIDRFTFFDESGQVTSCSKLF